MIFFPRQRTHRLQTAKRRQPEYKRRFFKHQTKLIGPKIYLSTKRQSKLATGSSWRPKVYWLVFCGLLIGLSYLFWGLKFWQVNQINFIDNDRLNTRKMEEHLQNKLNGRKLLILPVNHYFLVNDQELSKSLVDNFPELKTADIEKSFPHILKISLKRKRPALIWVRGDPEFFDKEIALLEGQTAPLLGEDSKESEDRIGQAGVATTSPILLSDEDRQKKITELAAKKESVKYFLIDEDGVVGKEVPAENLSLTNLWLVYDRGAGELKNNQQLVDRDWLGKLKFISQTLKEQLDLTAVYFALPSIESGELYVKVKLGAAETAKDWFVYLSLNLDLEKTLADFREVYKKQIISQSEQAVKEYVDLRIAGKVFWY